MISYLTVSLFPQVPMDSEVVMDPMQVREGCLCSPPSHPHPPPHGLQDCGVLELVLSQLLSVKTLEKPQAQSSESRPGVTWEGSRFW